MCGQPVVLKHSQQALADAEIESGQHLSNRLTVRKCPDHDVLRGDPRAVLVVGHHAEAVLCVLLQSSHGVRLAVYVNILKHKTERNQ